MIKKILLTSVATVALMLFVSWDGNADNAALATFPFPFTSFDKGVYDPPEFVNAGTQTGSGAGDTTTLPLPGSRVNGNLLLAVMSVRSDSSMSTTTNGWTKWQQGNGSSGGLVCGVAIFYRFVDGTETDITISHGAGSHSGRILQYTKTSLASPPIGASRENDGNGSPHSVNGITTTRRNSLVIYINGNRGGTVATPTNFSEDADSGSVNGAGVANGSVEVANSGSTTANISVTSTASSGWAMWQIELLTPA